MTKLRQAFAALLLAAAILLAAPSAFAACTGPAGNEGDMIYNKDFNTVQFCDATNIWQRLGGQSVDGRIGTMTANKWCAVNAGGTSIDCTQNTPSGALGGGTSGYLGVWTGTSSLGLSSTAPGQQLFWDATNNRLGVGLIAPIRSLDVGGTGLRASGSAGYQSIVAVKSSSYGSEPSAGIAIDDGTNDTGLLLGADAGNDVAYLQSLDPGDSYTSRPLLLNPNGGFVGVGATSPNTLLTVGNASAPNGTSVILQRLQLGADGTLGPTTVMLGAMPSATGTSRYGFIGTGDNAAMRPLVLNTNGANGFGSVGIGSTSPLATRMEVAGNSTANVPPLVFLNSYKGSTATTGLDAKQFAIGMNDVPQVYMGTMGALASGTPSLTYFYINTEPTDSNQVYTDPDLVITANGRVGIGTTTPDYELDLEAGTVRATAYLYTSDRRLKENIETVKGLDIVSRLHGVSFTWKDSGKPATGVIAQEVEEVLPNAVSTDEKGMKAVDYQQMIGPMIEAIKDLKAENEALRARVDALEAGR